MYQGDLLNYQFLSLKLFFLETKIDRSKDINKILQSPKKSKQAAVSTTLLPDSYLEILGSSGQSKVVAKTINSVDVEGSDHEQIEKDMKLTLDKAMKAAKEGDADEASFLFRLHARMKSSSTQAIRNEAVAELVTTPLAINDTSKDSIELIQNLVKEELPIIENGITFMPGE